MTTPTIFGTHQGQTVFEATLESSGASLSITSLGACLRDWRVDHMGRSIPVNNGFTSVEDYINHAICHGMIMGRVGNRTSGGGFTLDGKRYDLPANDGPNHLHGGPDGWHTKVWTLDTDQANNAVILSLHSPDGDAGYPGNVDAKITISLDGTTMTMVMEATTDAPTPINLAQHTYYNLNGTGQVRDHLVWVNASRMTQNDAALIPTGEIVEVAGTRYDFRTPATFRQRDGVGAGVDGNYVLNDNPLLEPAAIIIGEQTGLKMQLWTDQPGLQIFNGPEFTYDCLGIDGEQYGPFTGYCFEPQHHPDSLNNQHFPSIICGPDKPYYQKLVVDISG